MRLNRLLKDRSQLRFLRLFSERLVWPWLRSGQVPVTLVRLRVRRDGVIALWLWFICVSSELLGTMWRTCFVNFQSTISLEGVLADITPTFVGPSCSVSRRHDFGQWSCRCHALSAMHLVLYVPNAPGALHARTLDRHAVDAFNIVENVVTRPATDHRFLAKRSCQPSGISEP